MGMGMCLHAPAVYFTRPPFCLHFKRVFGAKGVCDEVAGGCWGVEGGLMGAIEVVVGASSPPGLALACGARCQTYANERVAQRRPQLHAAGQRQRDKAAVPFIRNL